MSKVVDVTPTGFSDGDDCFLQRCHPYGVEEKQVKYSGYKFAQ